MTKHILVVDDDPYLREIVELAIDCFTDWRVDTATTGAEALRKAIARPFDAILLDISLPDSDGFEIFESLRSLPTHRTTPVIALTAQTQSLDRRRLTEMNVAGVIQKPFASEILCEQIAKILRWTS
ncbi:response regulator [Pannus brasiliensis CCIBt3594]|uniref:Response regulator n=1 Tax=Pannus brasiliensis CCIBt3594 TaxID=1427578 RepID=A0AAW9QMM0_9CHRO